MKKDDQQFKKDTIIKKIHTNSTITENEFFMLQNLVIVMQSFVQYS